MGVRVGEEKIGFGLRLVITYYTKGSWLLRVGNCFEEKGKVCLCAGNEKKTTKL